MVTFIARKRVGIRSNVDMEFIFDHDALVDYIMIHEVKPEKQSTMLSAGYPKCDNESFSFYVYIYMTRRCCFDTVME